MELVKKRWVYANKECTLYAKYGDYGTLDQVKYKYFAFSLIKYLSTSSTDKIVLKYKYKYRYVHQQTT